jgi:hypothetical protein
MGGQDIDIFVVLHIAEAVTVGLFSTQSRRTSTGSASSRPVRSSEKLKKDMLGAMGMLNSNGTASWVIQPKWTKDCSKLLLVSQHTTLLVCLFVSVSSDWIVLPLAS